MKKKLTYMHVAKKCLCLVCSNDKTLMTKVSFYRLAFVFKLFFYE